MRRPPVYDRSPVDRLLWWKIDPASFEYNLSHYETADFLESARGRAILCLTLSTFLGVLLAATLGAVSIVSGVVASIALILAFFIYRGHLWANAVTMVFWTVGKLSQLLVPPFWLYLIPSVLWWAFFMHFFYLSYRVEKERKRRRREDVSNDSNEIPGTPAMPQPSGQIQL